MDKPLHVQVAECLGWINCHDRGDGLWEGNPPPKPSDGIGFKEVPHYDKTWCAAGPLVERFEMSISKMESPFTDWQAYDREGRFFGCGATPSEAISELILELYAEDKLTA